MENQKEILPNLVRIDSSKDGVPLQSQHSLNPENQGSNKYHLHSILIHKGQVNFGHYYAFIRPNLDDKWYEFNDQRVE